MAATAWETALPCNPFAPVLALLALEPPEPCAPPQPKPAPSEAAVDPREAEKLAQIERQFAQMEAKRERAMKMKALREEREASDPCKCGRARAKRLPRPLATGGPRCNTCLPLVPPRGAPALRDVPVFEPTEEEFRDPMGYIRSIQARFYDTGICLIQPPKSWKPPTSFHWRGSQEERAEAARQDGGRLLGASGDGSAGDSASTSPDGDGDGAAAAAAPPPMARRQGSESYSTEPISEDMDFYARLQTVKARRHTPDQPHCAPFTCGFTPKYAKYSIAELRRLDAAFRSEVFPEIGAALPPPEAVEAWFWEGLASEAEAKILYSSDLEGTAFPETGTYGEHAWSLQKLATHPRSLLRFVEYGIPGVNSPMLYFGMLFSMFCWHVEDNYMYSISYLHEGAPKTWYGVSPADAAEFDRVFTTRGFVQEVEADPQLLLKKASMLPPSLLVDEGVAVSRAVQRPGQFIVTLPQAYHAGFSHGFNTAEAVNFMLLDWLPYARLSMARYRALNREPVLDVEQILVRASSEARGDEGLSAEISAEVDTMVETELRLRAELRRAGCEERTMEQKDRNFALGRGPPCFRCSHVCHLSFVQCGDDRSHSAAAASRAARVEACLMHVDDLREQRGDGDGALTLFTRYADEFLEQLAERSDTPPRRAAATLPAPGYVPTFHALAPAHGAEKQNKKQKLRR